MSLLGGQEVFGISLKNEFDFIALSNQGLERVSLDTLSSFLRLPKKYFVEQILDMSVKTIEWKKADDRLGRHTVSGVS